MAQIELTESQMEIIGYALGLAVRDQKAKLDKIMSEASETTGARFVAQVDGFHERIARLEDAYRALPA